MIGFVVVAIVGLFLFYLMAPRARVSEILGYACLVAFGVFFGEFMYRVWIHVHA